jgi:hypothetical protein
MPKLKYLYVDNNPLASLPNDVVEAGSEAVLAYQKVRPDSPPELSTGQTP